MKIKYFIATALIFLSYPINLAHAQLNDSDIPRIRCDSNAPTGCFELSTVFTTVVSSIGILFGFGFFVMMVYGGMKYLLSGGDPKAVQGAKDTITWAIIGLALLALSYTILLIISAFTGVDVTRFRIGV